MRRWLTVNRIGDGTWENPYRPDLKGVAGIAGHVVAADDGAEMMVLVRRDQGPLDTLKGKAGVKHTGDEGTENGNRVIGAALRAALRAEAQRLGANVDWEPEGFDVGG